jgi:hypothetical protein
MEAALRRRALAALRRGIQAGDALQDICAALGIDRARLRDWQRHHDARVAKGTRAPALGRKPRECTEHTWTAMRHHLALFGPGLGARELRLEFPDASYWDCESAAWMFRRELRWFFNRCTMTACTWNVPGSVWAADVWQPDQPVEGCYPYILDVRDLATGYMIESMPLKHCTAALVTGTLERLYRIHGAPLVLKTDNGVEFTQGHS